MESDAIELKIDTETNFDTQNSKITMKKYETQRCDHTHTPPLKIEKWHNQAEKLAQRWERIWLANLVTSHYVLEQKI